MELRKYCTLLFFICLVLNVLFLSVGWDHTILGSHACRQTQNGITTYYMIKEGLRLDYYTPVAGKPWSIPLEFPFFQGITAVLVKSFGTPLEQTGRAVNAFFYYSSLLVLYILLGYLGIEKTSRILFICLLLASPLYIFWSRSFMIETIALFFSLCFLAAVLRFSIKRTYPSAVLAGFAGACAGLSKISTFIVFLLPIGVVYVWFCHRVRKKVKKVRSLIGQTALIFGIPVLLSMAWMSFSLHTLARNPFSYLWLPVNGIGSLAQRLSLREWLNVYTTLLCLLGDFSLPRARYALLLFFVLFLIGFIASRRYRGFILVCIACFLWGPLVFTQLYIVHSYYYYATGIFLLCAVGFLLIDLLVQEKYRFVTGFVILPALLLSMFGWYLKAFYPEQAVNDLSLVRIAEAVQHYTREEDIILCYNDGGSPQIPYYAKRKALIDPTLQPLHDSHMKRVLEALQGERPAAMVFETPLCKQEDFVQERLRYFGFPPQPVFHDENGDVYLRSQQ